MFAEKWELTFAYKPENFKAKKNPMPFYPWYSCFGDGNEMLVYGGLRGNKNGLYDQFPEAEWGINTNAVMEQIWAIGLELAECPVPKFRKVVKISYPRARRAALGE